MANVLNEFLHGVSKGFQDAAFAAFSRRRSTVREDIAQSFGGPETDEGGKHAGAAGADYLSMLNAEPAPALEESLSAPAPEAKASGRKAPAAKKGVVDAGKKSSARRGRRDDGGLREV
jgi:hypothetical protein